MYKRQRLSWSVHIHEITSSLLEKWILFIRKGILCLRNNSYASMPLMTIPVSYTHLADAELRQSTASSL